jgi:hypothetical protein
MYSIDLTRFPLDEFEQMLREIDLLPSRRILLEGLSGVMERLQGMGIDDLAALRTLLRNKKRYPELADELSTSVEYLTVLNREVNAYAAKPVALDKLDIFSAEELERLAAVGVKSTKHLYDACLTRADRAALVDQAGVPMTQLVAGLELADLLRINGVGPVYARVLRGMAITSPAAYLHTDSQEILARYQQVSADADTPQASLGLKDVEYCKRFCARLDDEVEW